MSVTGAIMAGIGAAGGITSSVIGSSAANHAASTQANASDYAANLSYQAGQNALDFQKQQFDYLKSIQAPWLRTGQTALSNLNYLMGLPGNYNFSAPNTTGTGLSGKLPNRTPYGFPFTNSGTGTGTGDGTSPVLTNGYAGYGGNGNSNAYTNAFPTANSKLLAATDNGATDSGVTTDLLGNTGVDNSGTTGTTGTTGTDGTTGTTGTNGTTGTTPPDLTGNVNPNLGGYGSLLQPWTQTFSAPTDVTEQNDPGYQFRLAEAQKAIERSAAARGNLLTGGTAKALDRYAQDYASNEYQNVYSRAYNDYATKYNAFENNQTNTFNRLAALSGFGQTAANNLGLMGQNAATNMGNISLGTASTIGNDVQNAAAARASGYVGSANAISNGITGGINNLTLLALLNGGFGGGGGGGGWDASTFPGICWVAAELYGGWTNWRTKAIQNFLVTSTIPRIVRFVRQYAEHGEDWAEMVRMDSKKRERFRRLFDGFLREATV